MNYERLNLKKNDVWKADHVKHIDDAIAALATGACGSASEWIAITENTSMPSSVSEMFGIPYIGYNYITTKSVYDSLAVASKQCKFILDGNEFVVTSKWVEGNGMAAYAYGNTDAFLGPGNTGEPFILIPGWQEISGQAVYFILIINITDTQPTAHTCSIYSLEEVVTKLDAKYHDDDHIRAIIDEVIGEILGGDY